MAERSETGPTGSDAVVDAASDASAEPCTVCGEPVGAGRWHPVVLDTRTEDTRIRAFCSTACRERWE